MRKTTIFALTALSVSWCYDEPYPYPPAFPYEYSPPYRPYRPRLHHAIPRYEQPESQSRAPGAQPDDPDPVMAPGDENEVIGGDEPPRDPSMRRVEPQPPFERHRDHSGDYNAN
jgi:hypothetical protein